MTPRGRRPAGSPDAREAILAAARTAFARDGYQASLRGIAREAGVDPALVHHYFPSRAALFAKAIVGSIAGENADLVERAAAITHMDPDEVGEGIVRSFVSLWDTAGGDNFTAVVRAAIERDGTVEPFRDFIAGGILQPIVTRFCPDRPELRAQLIASQIIGLGMARWVAGLDQVSPLEAESLASLVGPTIQRYLLDELPGTPLVGS
ncbi:TetR family transcriptional regulator [Actinomyces massiliensis]|uniref:TetR/AcrR family transcriptional regulator n=1 Tax=Actinomyces massiliensis TaxID=461393 RepID=UPI002354E8A4|nr:TetR family transcriptional regulator [Actinomyces massiliensis]